MAETITLEDVALRLRHLGTDGLNEAFERICMEYAIEGERKAKKLSRMKLKPRSGRLSASIKGSVERKGNQTTLTLRAGNNKNLPYAPLHEFGGTVRPKKGKYLRIPLDNAKTGRGVDRFSGPLRSVAPDKFYFAMSKKGNALLFDRKTSKPWYLLVKSSRIPPRPTLGPVFKWINANMIPEIEGLLKIEMDKM